MTSEKKTVTVQEENWTTGSRLESNRDENRQTENGYGQNSFEVHQSQENEDIGT
jgi:hypothetical protein